MPYADVDDDASARYALLLMMRRFAMMRAAMIMMRYCFADAATIRYSIDAMRRLMPARQAPL